MSRRLFQDDIDKALAAARSKSRPVTVMLSGGQAISGTVEKLNWKTVWLVEHDIEKLVTLPAIVAVMTIR